MRFDRGFGVGFSVLSLVSGVGACLGSAPDASVDGGTSSSLDTGVPGDETPVTPGDETTVPPGGDAQPDGTLGPSDAGDGGIEAAPPPAMCVDGGDAVCGANGKCVSGTCGCVSGFTSCGTCTDTTMDAANCGRCGHSCGGGACSNGQCQPFMVGTFDSMSSGELAVDENNVYAVITGGVPELDGSRTSGVEACSVNGCSAPTVLARDIPQYGYDIFANSTGVFWTSITAGGAAGFKVPEATGTAGVYASYSTEQPIWIVADSQNAYWTLSPNGGSNFAGIVSCPVSGCVGSPTVIFQMGKPFYLALGGSTLFYPDSTGLEAVSTSAADANQVASLFAPAPSGHTYSYPAADSTDVVWADDTSSATGISACPITGCPGGGPIVITSQNAGGPAIDASGVYWTTGTSILKCAASGCASNPTTVVSGITASPLVTVVNSTAIFWANGDVVWKIAK